MPIMDDAPVCASRRLTLLAINILFLMLWGFAAIGKLQSGLPPWFDQKFGQTFFASFPGLSATFWLLAASELLAFLLGVIALVRLEALRTPREPRWLTGMIVWSLFVFLELSFGQWLIADFAGGFQEFVYFSGTLVALLFTGSAAGGRGLPQGP